MKFLAYERGTQFYSVTLKLPLRPLCGVTVTRRKMQLLSSNRSFLCCVTVARRTMATPQQRAQVVVWYAETKSFIMVQRTYWRVYGGDAPDTKTIKAWFDKFLVTRSVLKQSGGTHRSVSEEKVEEIHTAFQRSHSKSIRRALRELYVCATYDIALSTPQVAAFAYKVQITQVLKPDNKRKWLDFAINILHRIDMDPSFLPSILFSDKATFHQLGKVIRHIAHIWG
jgi:hypothetical protein